MSRLDDIERRLSALEEHRPQAAPPSSEDAFWALNTMAQHLPEGEGAVLFTGVIPVNGQNVSWQYGVPTSEVNRANWSELAPAFAALGSPVRLTLLQQIASGVQDVSDLAATEGIGTTGQVYHHLRALVAAGWLRATNRGHYEIPGNRLVPLYTCLVAGGDL